MLRGGLESTIHILTRKRTKISGHARADRQLFFDESIRLPSDNFDVNGS